MIPPTQKQHPACWMGNNFVIKLIVRIFMKESQWICALCVLCEREFKKEVSAEGEGE